MRSSGGRNVRLYCGSGWTERKGRQCNGNRARKVEGVRENYGK